MVQGSRELRAPPPTADPSQPTRTVTWCRAGVLTAGARTHVASIRFPRIATLMPRRIIRLVIKGRMQSVRFVAPVFMEVWHE